MIIGQLKDGIVLDHITAGNGMTIYKLLGLSNLDCQVALIQNAESVKMGRKDIIKVDKVIDINVEALGYVDPGVTVNIIKDGKLAKRQSIDVPERIKNVIKCKNPRCITTVEQELDHIFKLTDVEKGVYRCIYCETAAK